MNSVIDIRRYVDPSDIPTLVLVDLQQEYVANERPLAMPNAATALENCRLALAHARAMGFPVAFVRRSGSGAIFNAATRFARWIPGFEPWGADMVFERNRPSCYASPEFGEVMGCGDGHFIIAGFAGETSCLATAIDAFHRGHRFVFLEDACASHALDEVPPRDVHNVACKIIQLYGDVTNAAAWISATSHGRRARRTLHGTEQGHSA